MIQLDDNTWVEPAEVAAVRARLSNAGKRTCFSAPTILTLKSGIDLGVNLQPEQVIEKLTGRSPTTFEVATKWTCPRCRVEYDNLATRWNCCPDHDWPVCSSCLRELHPERAGS